MDAQQPRDAGRFAARVVEEAELALLHRAQMVAGLVVAHAFPGPALRANEFIDRINVRFALEQPVRAGLCAHQAKKRSLASPGSSTPVTRAFCTQLPEVAVGRAIVQLARVLDGAPVRILRAAAGSPPPARPLRSAASSRRRSAGSAPGRSTTSAGSRTRRARAWRRRTSRTGSSGRGSRCARARRRCTSRPRPCAPWRTRSHGDRTGRASACSRSRRRRGSPETKSISPKSSTCTQGSAAIL